MRSYVVDSLIGCSSPGLDFAADSISYTAHAEAIRSALNKVASTERQTTNFGEWVSSSSSSEEEADTREKEGSKT